MRALPITSAAARNTCHHAISNRLSIIHSKAISLLIFRDSETDV
jgi:hypothetical protein